MEKLKLVIRFVQQVVQEWSEDKAPQLGAALAYYTIFSLAPLLTLVLAIAGLVFGREAASGQLVHNFSDLVGPDGARAIQSMVLNARQPQAGIIATVFSVVMLLLGASGVFGQLKDALNTVWEVQPRPGRGIWGSARETLLSVTMVLGTGFLLLVSLVLTSVLAAVGAYFSSRLPGGAAFWQLANVLISFAIITGLFALMFKYIPDVRIDWRDVWVGAALTALLFEIGKLGIGLYIGNSSVSSVYGAAASLVVLLIWVYYSAQILFFGAEFTQVWARWHGREIQPAADAVPLSEAARAEQGIPHKQREEKPPAPRMPGTRS